MKKQPGLALTVSQIARNLNVNDATVRMWIANGKLSAYKLPGSGSQDIWRILPADYDRFLKTYRSIKVSA